MFKVLKTSIQQKPVFWSLLTNALDFYPFMLFVFLTPHITEVYFPQGSQASALRHSMWFLTLGFVMRPFGAYYFGHLGDTKGRKTALVRSSVITIVSSLGLAFVPSYQDISVVASVIVLFSRLLQGFAIAVRDSATMAFVSEHAKSGRMSYASGILNASGILGAAAAAITAIPFFLFTTQSYRALFIMTSFLSVLALYVRKELLETESYTDLKVKKRIVHNPFMVACRKYPKQLLQLIGLTGLVGLPFYLVCGYLVPKLTYTFDLSMVFILCWQGCFMLLFSLSTILSGALADR